MTRISVGELEDVITRALVRSNTVEASARSVARALTLAEMDGQKGHGLSRVASYAAQARAGKVDGHAVPVLTRVRPDRRRWSTSLSPKWRAARS
jgi:(2R)-3-sulfolactate dehydrogenase (NADP+)